MKSLTLVQLGDIHFPDHKGTRVGDLKDSAAPSSVVDAIAPSLLELVMRKVAEVASQPDVCALLVCGDLTTYGDIAEYTSCVEYLHRAIQIGDSTRWPDRSLHVVPGNHDVNRTLCDPDGIDLFGKFSPLIDSWTSVGRRSLLTVDSVRSTCVSPNTPSISLYSLNSCVGCGEHRHLPTKIRDQLRTTLSDYLKSAPPNEAFELAGEQLDTPAFVDAHVRSLVASVAQLECASIPVVLAHHNALPQSIPRVEIYTELINGGLLRSELASCGRPILYCHGHIHDDPIEQIRDWKYPTSNIVLVSAPLLVTGFNTITVEYSRNGLPLGIRINKYRCSTHGSVDMSGQISIPIVASQELPQFRDDKLTALLAVCNSDFKRFGQLREDMRVQLGTLLNHDSLRDVVLEAEWLSLIQVNDRHLECRHWKVRRCEP